MVDAPVNESMSAEDASALGNIPVLGMEKNAADADAAGALRPVAQHVSNQQ